MDQSRLEQPKLYKGLVLENDGEKLTIISSEGEMFFLCHKPGAASGDQIYFFEEDLLSPLEAIDEPEPSDGRNPWFHLGWKTLAAAAAAVLFFFVSNLSGLGSTVALMSIDINPSIELELRRDGTVSRVNSLNQDAAELVSQLNLKGKQYDEVLKMVIESARDKGYKVDHNSILVAFAPVSKQGFDLVEEMRTVLQDDAARQHYGLIASNKLTQIAKGDHLSLGKALVRAKLPEMNEEQFKKMSVHELYHRLFGEQEDQIWDLVIPNSGDDAFNEDEQSERETLNNEEEEKTEDTKENNQKDDSDDDDTESDNENDDAEDPDDLNNMDEVDDGDVESVDHETQKGSEGNKSPLTPTDTSGGDEEKGQINPTDTDVDEDNEKEDDEDSIDEPVHQPESDDPD